MRQIIIKPQMGGIIKAEPRYVGASISVFHIVYAMVFKNFALFRHWGEACYCGNLCLGH